MTEDGEVVLLTGDQSRQFKLYHLSKDEISEQQFVTEFSFVSTEDFMKLRKINEGTYVYAANRQGDIFKGVFGDSGRSITYIYIFLKCHRY